MQKTTSAQSQFRRLPGAKILLSVSLACALYIGATSAQVLVHDQGVITANQAGFQSQLAKTVSVYIKQIEQYKTQIEQYTTQLEQLRSILTKIQDLGQNISLTDKSLQPLDSTETDKLVAQACPGAQLGGMITGVISGFLGSSSHLPITERQQLICKQIVMLQVDEYNITATALGSLTVQKSTVQKLSDIVLSISTIGESNSASSQAQQFMSQLQLASATWRKQIEADQAMIATLQQQQNVLSKVALNGSNTVLGNIVQAAAFAAALQ